MSIRVSDDGRRITIHTVAITSLESVQAALAEVIQRVLDMPRHQAPQILFDLRRTLNTLAMADNHRLAYEFVSRIQDNHKTIIAIVRDEDDRTYDFSETLIRNTGLTARIFVHSTDAIEWLEAQARAFERPGPSA